MTDTIDRFARSGVRTLAVAEVPGVIDEPGGKHDPHLWMDVKLWSQAADRIVEVLCAADPDSGTFRVDGIDGPIARKVRVRDVIPRVDGAVLDLVVDYLTYVLVPAKKAEKATPWWSNANAT